MPSTLSNIINKGLVKTWRMVFIVLPAHHNQAGECYLYHLIVMWCLFLVFHEPATCLKLLFWARLCLITINEVKWKAVGS